MAFSWLGMFGAHDYMHLRQFLLEELRSVSSRAIQIDAEVTRIGRANIVWDTDENGNATETRIGFVVGPSINTTLGKLMRAYVAQGGNPFDICMYLNPEKGVNFTANEDGSIKYLQPYGGLITVKTRENTKAGFDAGGELIYPNNPRLRIGKAVAQDRAEPVASQIASARGWANQAIREKRSDLEWQIVKMLDLSEQLVTERRQVLGQAVEGMVEEYRKAGDFAKSFTLRHHISTLDKIVFEADLETDLPIYGKLNIQSFQKGFYDYLWPPRQAGEDDFCGLKIPDGLQMDGEDRTDVIAGLAAPSDGSEVDEV